MKQEDRPQFYAFLGRVPYRATIEQLRAAFKGSAEAFVAGALDLGFMEKQGEHYYTTAAGKRALQDYRSVRK